MPIPGTTENFAFHSIPYHLTKPEAAAFIRRHTHEPELSAYLVNKIDPPYGIIVNEAYGEYLVWYDATLTQHIVDITNMGVAREIAKAPYESPDGSFVQNLIEDLKRFIDELTQKGEDYAGLLLAIGILVGIGYFVRTFK